MDGNGDVIDNELTEIKGYYVYRVFEKGKNKGFQFNTHSPDNVQEMRYDSFLTLSTSLNFDVWLSRTQGNQKLFKREQNGDSLVILETVEQKKDKSYNDTVLTKYRKGKNNFAFQFSTILDTIKGMRFETMELIYKGDDNFDAPFESRPRKFTFSSTPAIPDKWEEFDKAINVYKERSKPL